MGIIYRAKCLINGKCYIGKTTNSLNKRKNVHLYMAFNKNENKKNILPKFYRALRKYGSNSFEWEIIKDNIPNKDLNLCEMWFIATFDTKVNGYNTTYGGEETTYDSLTEEQKIARNKKISKAIKGKKHNLSEKERKNRSKRMKENSKLHPRGVNHRLFGIGLGKEIYELVSKRMTGENNPSSYVFIMKKNNCSLEEAKEIRKKRLNK